MAAQDEGLFTATLWTDGELAAENIQVENGRSSAAD